ncbi:MAG: hypothetical protein ACRC9V_00330 [Aeromonas sp.]
MVRSRQISLQDTPYHHVDNRYMGRVFLGGEDGHFDHEFKNEINVADVMKGRAGDGMA